MARKPTAGYAKYNTEFYELYDPENPQTVEPVPGPFRSFGAYDSYKLYSQGQIQNYHDIPTSGVRIDDLTISCVMNLPATILHRNWPADLDTAGMIRATRMPLGDAAKMWVNIGDTDVEGKVVSKGQEGWYYKWWRGLHCLMGKEGFDAGMYLIRPSFESFIVRGFSFKIGYGAVVQVGERGSEWRVEGGEAENATEDEEVESGTEDEGGIVDEDEDVEESTRIQEIEDEVSTDGIGIESENELAHMDSETRDFGVDAFAKLMARGSASRDSL